MKIPWKLVAIVGGVAAVGAAMSGGGDDGDGRLPDRRDEPPPPDRFEEPPQRAPNEPSDPVTLQMMQQPQPMPNVSVPSPSWSRALIRNRQVASRTETEETWNDASNELQVKPVVRHKLLPGAWVVARLWLSSDYAPANDGDEYSPAAAFWTWSGPLEVGTTLQLELDGVAIVGQDRPRMNWVNAGVRINIFGEIELRIIYPGEQHTGKERGRKYDVVFEWRALPSEPI